MVDVTQKVAPPNLSQGKDAASGGCMDAACSKARLRTDARAVRDGIAPDGRAAASAAIAGRFLEAGFLGNAQAFNANGGVIAGYWPIRSEATPLPLLHALAVAGFATSLPVVAHPTLIFRRWSPEDALVDAGFGTFGPADNAPECAPTLVLVPCLAFDRSGGRLGYGAGHFDRALARLRQNGPVRVVALAFAAQEVASVFAEAHDQPLDAIVTERELIWPTSLT